MQRHVQLEPGRNLALPLFAKHALHPVLNVAAHQHPVQHAYMLTMPLPMCTWKGPRALKRARLEALTISTILLILYVLLVLHLVKNAIHQPLVARNAKLQESQQLKNTCKVLSVY
jgi:hypothetical protein